MKKANTPQKPRSGLIAALDVGSTKMCCLIAKPGERGPEVVGIGHHVSRGIRAGAVIDLGEAEAAIRATVEAAEKMAGENIRGVMVTLGGGQPTSRLLAYEVSIAGHQITDADLNRILNPADLAEEFAQDRELIHAIPVGYCIDGNRGVHDPRGLYGETLAVNMHVVTAASGPARNLETCVNAGHLELEDKVLSAYASGLSALVEDEKQLGVTLIDFGGGTTSVGVFFDGELVHSDLIPIGGNHITNDIARGLSTPRANAERMKTLYGSTIATPSDDREVIHVPLVGEEDLADAVQVPRSMLVAIVRPRVEEILELVRDRLKKAGFDQVAGRRCVVTGGGAQLTGLPEMTASILDKQVRMGRPRGVQGLADAVSGPAFSAAAGMLHYAMEHTQEARIQAFRPTEEPSTRLGKLGQWIRENF